MIEEAISHPDKELDVLQVPHPRSLTSSPFDARSEDALITRSASPNHLLGKVTGEAQSHVKVVNSSPAAPRKATLATAVPSTVSESSRYVSTDSNTTTARSGIESITATQPAAKGFSEAVVTSRPSAWAPKRQDDAQLSSRPIAVETQTLPPPPLPVPVPGLSNGPTAWSTPTCSMPVTSAVVQQLVVTSTLLVTSSSSSGSKSVQTRCKSSEPMETDTPTSTSMEVQVTVPRSRHSRSFSDPAGAFDVVPPSDATPIEQSSLPPDVRLKGFVPSMPTIVSPRVSGQESDIVGLHESMANVHDELAAAVEQTSAKEGSENKRLEGKETSSLVVGSPGSGEQPVPKTTKTVAVITPTQVFCNTWSRYVGRGGWYVVAHEGRLVCCGT